MKYSIHVPVAQYGFIQVDDIKSREEAILEYKQTIADFENKGIDPKEFTNIIDKMIAREKIQGDPGIFEGLSPSQRYGFDLVRKSLGRIDYKNR